MRATQTPAVPTNRVRTRAGSSTTTTATRIGTRSSGRRKVVTRTAAVTDRRPTPEVPADADYFVHPFVD